MNRCRKSFGFRSNFAKYSFQFITWLYLMSTVRICGTHFVETFFISKWAEKIYHTHQLRCTQSQQSHALSLCNHLSQYCGFLSIISDVVSYVGRQEHMLVQPCMNPVFQYCIIDNEGAVAPLTFMNSTLISLVVFFSKTGFFYHCSILKFFHTWNITKFIVLKGLLLANKTS